MRPLRDPAPSRLAYRMNRLLLTRGVRGFLRYGLPVLVLLSAAGVWLADPARRQELGDRAAELRRQIEQRPEFQVRMMAVEAASPGTAAEIRERLPLDFPISSFDLDLGAIRAEVESLDEVRSATVYVRGGVLGIEVEERAPVAVWRHGQALELVDAEGQRVAAVARRDDRSDLPLIGGPGANRQVGEALAIFTAAQAVRPRIRGLIRVGERRWDVVLDRDQKIMLPDSDPVGALRRIMELDAAQDLLARDVAVVDFRNPRRPVLRLNRGAVDSMIDAHMTETKDTTR